MNPADIIRSAREAGSRWSCFSLLDRRKVLARFAHVLALHQDDLRSAIVRDTGKPDLDALSGDLLVTLEHMRFYRKYAHKLLAPRRIRGNWILTGRSRFTEFFEPHGVVLVYGPSNYPLQLALIPAITALHAGNSVVLKLSEDTPLLAALLRHLVEEARMPPDLLQVVCNSPETAAEYIDARPDFVCFTGSTVNGIHVAQRAAQYLIPTLLELGGKDAALVFADCALDRTVEGILYGAFANSGRVCVAIKRLYVERSIYALFTRRLVERAAQLRVAHHDASAQDLAPIGSAHMLQILSVQIADALGRGAEVLNKTSDLSGATPLILGSVPPDAQILTEEVFGPVLCVAPFQDEAEAIRHANNCEFSLGATLWTQDKDKPIRISKQLHAANIAVNDVIRNIANPAASFGGNKASGYGRYHGVSGLRTFSRTKTVMTTRSRSKRQRNWFPLTVDTFRQLRRFVKLRYAGIARHFCWCCLMAVSILGTAAFAGQSSGHLHVRVEISPSEKGQLAYLIFRSSDGFPKDRTKAFRQGFLPPDTPLNDIDLGELPKGRYAVSLFLDENGNHKLDSGWLGIPKEPVGASRNPHPRMGPPRFEDCVFEMNESDLTLDIRMVRP